MERTPGQIGRGERSAAAAAVSCSLAWPPHATLKEIMITTSNRPLDHRRYNCRPITATNAYDLLTSETMLKIALDELAALEPTARQLRLGEIFDKTYFKHEAKEQRAGEIGTSQNYLEYLGPPEIVEICS